MHNKKQLLRNSSLSFILNLSMKAANVIIFIVIGRLNGAGQAGVFSLATTYLLIFSALALGLDELLIRQVARNHEVTARYFSAFLALRVVLSVGLYIILVGLIRSVYDVGLAATILVLGFSLIPDSLASVGQAALIAHERFEIPVLAALLSSTVKIIGSIIALRGGSLLGVGQAWVIGSTLGSIVILIAAVRLAGHFQLWAWADRQFWAQHIQVSIPFLVIGFILTMEYQLDVIILKSLRNEVDVGWYSAATTIIFGLTLFSQAYRVAIYPRMVNEHKSSSDALRRTYHLSFFYLGAAALPIATGVTLLSPAIVRLVYGPAFDGAVTPLRIIVWSLVFLYLNIPSSRLMLVSEQQNRLAWFVIGSMGVNVLLNLLLDPYWGATGAAIGRVVSTATFFFPNYIFVNRHLQSHNILHSLAKPALATLVMAVTVWPFRHATIWLPILIGMTVYVATICLLDKESRSFFKKYLLEKGKA